MRLKVIWVLALALLVLAGCRTQHSREQDPAGDPAAKVLSAFFEAQKNGQREALLELLTPAQRSKVTQPGAQLALDKDLKVRTIKEGNPTNLPAKPYLDAGYTEVRFFFVTLEDRSGQKNWTYIVVKDSEGRWQVADWGV